MKKSKLKIAISTLIVLTLMFFLVACSNNKNENSDTKENKKETSEDNKGNVEKKEEKTDKDEQENKEGEDKQESLFDDELHKVAVKGGELTGILTMPAKVDNPEELAIVLFVPGSGAPPKNGVANEFGLLSGSLAKSGIASFRYDKRGTYDSNSIVVDETKLKVNDFVEDIDAIITHLKNDKRFKKVYVLGHSQGGLFSSLAIQKNKVDGFISVSAPGRNIADVLKEQIKNNPMNPAELVREAEDIVNKLKQKKNTDEINPLLEPLFKRSIQDYLIDWMSYNPSDEYKKITETPVLIIQGTNDIQVSVEDAKILANSFPDTKPILIEKMSHILKDAPTKDNWEEHIKIYSNVKAPINEEFVRTVVEFVKGEKKEDASE